GACTEAARSSRLVEQFDGVAELFEHFCPPLHSPPNGGYEPLLTQSKSRRKSASQGRQRGVERWRKRCAAFRGSARRATTSLPVRQAMTTCTAGTETTRSTAATGPIRFMAM